MEDCHNYIYANEGILKEKAFQEIAKILYIKIYIEKNVKESASRLFMISKEEYRNVFSGSSRKPFEIRIKKMYRMMSGQISLNIWKDGPLLSLKTMAYIISRLQNFRLTSEMGDIAGQAFQTFVHHHQRGARGEFFTPAPVVELAVKIIRPKASERVIDPACGSGSFLLSAIRHIGRGSPRGRISDSALNAHGIEFNPDVALAAKLLMEIEGGSESNIICANALCIEEQHNSFDIALTNPPFGSRGKVEDPSILEKYDLGKKWEPLNKAAGNEAWQAPQDSVLCARPPEILFIEKCLKLLKPGGRMAAVIPDGLLQNPSLAFVRHWIKSKAGVAGVISLPPETFIPFGTGVKTSLLILRKGFQKKSVFFSKISNIGYDIKGNMFRAAPPAALNDSRKAPALNSADGDINHVIKSFCGKTADKPPAIAWRVKKELLKHRWDAEHYSLHDMEIISRLDSSQTLSNFAEIAGTKERFSRHSPSLEKYIAISDIDRHGMKIASHQTLRSDRLPSRASYRIFEGDILIAVSGASAGTEKQAVAMVSREYHGSICSNGFAVLRNIKNIDRHYLLAFFKTDIFIKQVRRMMTGHAIPYISLSNLGKILVPAPDKKIQEKAAERARRIIELGQAQHEEMACLKKETSFML